MCTHGACCPEEGGPELLDFTRHAKNRMRLYGVTEQDVQRVLEAPARTITQEDGKQRAWAMHRDQTLCVVWTREKNIDVIITIMRLDDSPGGSG